MEVNINDYSGFIVTGRKYMSNRRFRLSYSGGYAGFRTADSINLWNGTMFGLLPNGKRKVLKRVIN